MTRDPDLDKACVDLNYVAQRVRTLESMIVDAASPGHYQRLAAMKFELSDLRTQFRVRAEVLKIDPRALMMIVEKAESLRKRSKRRPNPQSMELAIGEAYEAAQVAATSAEADAVLAKYAAAQAGYALRAAADAVRYLAACR